GLAASPEFHLDMNIEEGDIQFLNNRVIVHARTGYEDWPGIARRRHMLRLWLDVPNWPAMPERQVMHSAADRAVWVRRRQRGMEFPSVYLAAMSEALARRAAAGPAFADAGS